MWTLYRASGVVISAGILCSQLCVSSVAFADDNYFAVNQNQTGINLPSPVSPHGFDEVRAADGTTCRSSLGNDGAYVDTGVLGGGGTHGGASNLSAYGRIVIPLGRRIPRLNCKSLYDLEIERLQLEVKMLKRGLDPTMGARGDSWANDDQWSSGDRK